METVTIDIETKSDRDIMKSGVYAYADSKYFDILLFSYSVDGGAVQVIDLANGETIPDKILKAFADENIIKQAFNVNFERVCLSVYVQRNYPQYFRGYEENYFNPAGWHCTMIHSRILSLPSSLAEVGRVLKIQEQKMAEGKALIKFFCVPYQFDNDEPEFHNPLLYPDKWEIFKAYNKRDVEAELEIDRRLSRYPVPDFIWEEFYIDQKINDRGILIDMDLVDSAIKLDEESKKNLSAEMCRLTGVENPNSVYQLLRWLEEQGYSSDSLGKKEVAELLKTAGEPVRSVLKLRQQLAKSSVKKYTAMKQSVCSDSRARGMFSFYGASRTGRFSGKNIQLQNLRQNHIPDLANARELVKSHDAELIEMLYDDVPDTLSQLVRTAFIPKKGCKFIVCDYSSIEMRLSAFYAGEQWVTDTFADGGDIYCKTASQMFGVPVVKNGINGHLRQRGKQASLSCSYGGSTGALTAMGALEQGMKESELKPLVDAWRQANPNIVRFWYAMENAAIQAVQGKTATETHGIRFIYRPNILFMELPSKRRLAYIQPQIGINQFGSESITYMGLNAAKKWSRLETFGGKLVENCIQGIARDLLCHSMKTLSGCRIVAHVHDELIIEADESITLDYVSRKMAEVPDWAEGLQLRADGYECEFYQKN